MKKRILCLATVTAVLLTALSGCGSKEKSSEDSASQASSSSSVSQTSQTSSATSAESSDPSEVSKESTVPFSPSKPEISSVDMKFWSAEELKELIEKSKLEGITVETYEYVPVTGSDKLYSTTAEITVTGLFDDVLSLSKFLAGQEKNNIYIDGFSLSVDYNSDVTAVIKVINPYPTGDDQSTDELKDYIGIRWNSVDKNAAIAAFIDENSNYYLKSASCDFAPAEDGSITFLAGIDFSTYNGFVAYRYKLGRSEKFTLSENVAIEEKSEYYDDKAFHADVILTSNKFNR